jgi:hypothetical protein
MNRQPLYAASWGVLPQLLSQELAVSGAPSSQAASAFPTSHSAPACTHNTAALYTTARMKKQQSSQGSPHLSVITNRCSWT